jgi:hypothetical protein
MKTLTYAEFASILESHRACDWNPRMPSPYCDSLGPTNRQIYYLPPEAGRQRYLCQLFDELFGFTECLLHASDTLMTGEYGLQSVFDAYLKSLGVTPPNKGSYACQFTAHDMQICRDLLSIAVLGGWDVYAFSPTNKTVVCFSHHDLFDVFTASPGELATINGRLEEFGLQRVDA